MAELINGKTPKKHCAFILARHQEEDEAIKQVKTAQEKAKQKAANTPTNGTTN